MIITGVNMMSRLLTCGTKLLKMSGWEKWHGSFVDHRRR